MGMKLYTKKDGPFLIDRIGKSGVSEDLKGLKSGLIVGEIRI